MFILISFIVVIVLSSAQLVVGQNDTIKVINGLSIVGDVKNFRRNTFKVEVDFSTSDIRIDWDDIESIWIQNSS